MDLDNTLWDWVHIWHEPFKAQLEVLIAKSGLDRDVLLDDIRSVHQEHGTSEYVFLIQELPCLQARHPDEDLVELYSEAIDAYRRRRREVLRLYPTVLDTLEELRRRGTLIVAYTESLAYYTSYRLRRLELAGLLDVVYSPVDHDMPRGLTKEQLRRYPPLSYALEGAEHRHTPGGELKPSPAVLLSILRQTQSPVNMTVYVGDSLMRDVAMAQEAGIIDVHAKYGDARGSEAYELLRRVTHWSDDEVEQERRVESEGEVRASIVLAESFADLLEHFEFVAYDDHLSAGERIRTLTELWTKTVDVQQHFNDIELRIRNIAMALVGVLVAVAAVAVREGAAFVGAGVVLSAAVAWVGFYFMDYLWYHRLLLGSVAYGRELEEEMRRWIPGGPARGLTDAISEGSPYEVPAERTIIRRLLAPYLDDGKLRSSAKMHLFYHGFGVVLLMFFSACVLIGLNDVGAVEHEEAISVILRDPRGQPLQVGPRVDTVLVQPDTVYVGRDDSLMTGPEAATSADSLPPG